MLEKAQKVGEQHNTLPPWSDVFLILWIHTPTLRQCLGDRAKNRHVLGILAILPQEQIPHLYALGREYGILLTPLNHVQVVYHVHLTPNKKYTPSVNGVYQAAISLLTTVLPAIGSSSHFVLSVPPSVTGTYWS